MRTAMAKLDDSDLIQMALAGHGECFGELVHRHTSVVRRRVVSIIRNSPDADDVVQEAFLKAWRALSTFRGEASLKTWLISIATNEALACLRRERKRRDTESLAEFDTLACDSEPTDQAVIRGEESRAIRGAILKLPLKYREVVILRDLEELNSNATAKRLNATLSTVKTRLFRGRLKLAAALRDSDAQTLQAA